MKGWQRKRFSQFHATQIYATSPGHCHCQQPYTAYKEIAGNAIAAVYRGTSVIVFAETLFSDNLLLPSVLHNALSPTMTTLYVTYLSTLPSV